MKKKLDFQRQNLFPLAILTRFSEAKFVSIGDTNSSFYRPAWETVDLIDADYIVDFRQEPLPFENNSLNGVHSSHLIEHISQEAGLQLFQEIYRCLKPGGIFRFSTPDMDLLLERYKLSDWKFFLQADGSYILKRILDGDLSSESLLMHNRVSLLKPNRTYAHIHLYDYQELETGLKKIGFKSVCHTKYGESSCPAMVNPPIDRLQHQTYSLYIEAIK